MRGHQKTRKLEFYAWYPGDFRQDTQHLTRDERHAYRDLFDEIFITDQETCRLPDDDFYLARVVQRSVDEWKGMRYALIDGPRPLLLKREGWIYSKRLSEEIEKAKVKSGARKSAADARWGNDPTEDPCTCNANALQTHCKCIQSASMSKSSSPTSDGSRENEEEIRGENEISESDFETLWSEYPNKDGRKQARRHFFASVRSEIDLQTIHVALLNYRRHLEANPWKRPKNGSTWFNNWRDWERWVEPSHPEETHGRAAQTPYVDADGGRRVGRGTNFA